MITIEISLGGARTARIGKVLARDSNNKFYVLLSEDGAQKVAIYEEDVGKLLEGIEAWKKLND